jgi:hypothetical protein
MLLGMKYTFKYNLHFFQTQITRILSIERKKEDNIV